MGEKVVIPYLQIIGGIEIGKGVEYVMDCDEAEIFGYTLPVISYDEVSEIFETTDTVYVPA